MSKEYIAELAKEFAKQREEYLSKVKALLALEFTKIFDEYEWVKSFSWKQYTPYWCDNDPCEFGVSTSPDYDIEINNQTHDEYIDTAEEDVEWMEAATKVANIVDIVEPDTLKAVYGDHVTVVITKTGVELVEYDHS